jgi:hypothetical protein
MVISEAQSPCLPPSAHSEEEATAKNKAEAEAAAKRKPKKKPPPSRKRKQKPQKKKLEEARVEIARALAGWLAPRRKLAKIPALLKHGGFTRRVTAPATGRLTIAWYLLPKGAHLSARKPLLVARGSVTIGATHTAKLTVKLMRAGRRLLKHSRSVELTARGTFKPAAGTSIVRLKVFTLHR